MRKEYWQLEVIFNCKDIDEYADVEELFNDGLNPYDWQEVLDSYMTQKFNYDFTSYDWKDMNDMAEDWVVLGNKGLIPFDAEGENGMGGDNYGFYWIPKDKMQEFIELGQAIGVGWYEADIGDIIDDSSHFYPEDLSDETKKALGYDYEEED